MLKTNGREQRNNVGSYMYLQLYVDGQKFDSKHGILFTAPLPPDQSVGGGGGYSALGNLSLSESEAVETQNNTTRIFTVKKEVNIRVTDGGKTQFCNKVAG